MLERVDDQGGQVKIGGEEWSARAFFEGQVLEPGTRVEVGQASRARRRSSTNKGERNGCTHRPARDRDRSSSSSSARTIRIIPQARAGVVERLGRYHRTLDAGLAIVIPFVDRLKPLIDLREQVVSFRPQPVITEDNLVVSIDTVIYFQVTDPKAATYEIAELHLRASSSSP